MTQFWLIERDGVKRQVVTSGVHPSEEGEDVEGAIVTPVASRGDLTFQKLNEAGTGWTADLEAVATAAIARINAEREQLQASAFTAGVAKAAVYAAKKAEAEAWNDLAGTAQSLSDEERAWRFPYAQQEAAVTGKAIDVVLSGYAQAAVRTHDYLARIEALAQDAIARVRGARSVTAMWAVAAVDWEGSNASD